MAKKVVSKSVQRRVAVQKTAVVKKPVREVQKAPLSDMLVTLDRVIAFLDHATTALNKMNSTMENFSRMTAGVAVEKVLAKEAVATPVKKEEVAAPVEHTPSYEIVMKKLPLCNAHDAVDILIGQINNSTKLRADEKVDLLERCQARKDLIPF